MLQYTQAILAETIRRTAQNLAASASTEPPTPRPHVEEVPNGAATLVVTGGGMKAFYLLGAISKLHEAGKLRRVRRFAGTSAGALISTLLALEFSPIEILSRALRLQSLCNIQAKSMVEFVFSAIDTGRTTFDDIMELLCAMMEERGVSRSTTFSQFKKVSRGRELMVVASRVSRYNVEEKVFSAELTPEVPISVAVRMSCSFPLLVDPVSYDGGVYLDGCIVNNFPVDRAVQHWDDDTLVIAVGIVRPGTKLMVAPRVHYIMVTKSKVYGEGLLTNTVDRLEMYLHARQWVGSKARRAST